AEDRDERVHRLERGITAEQTEQNERARDEELRHCAARSNEERVDSGLRMVQHTTAVQREDLDSDDAVATPLPRELCAGPSAIRYRLVLRCYGRRNGAVPHREPVHSVPFALRL